MQINKILIVGNNLTRNSIILRELRLKKGDVVSENYLAYILKKDQQKLFNLHLFNTATIRPTLVPAVVLPAVFFWSIFRPLSMSPVAVFALGLLQDLVTYAPLGIGVLSLLAVHGLAFRWRRALAGWSFLSVWLVFCGFAAGAAGLGWLLHAILSLRLPPLEPSIQFALLAAGLYPTLAWLMTRAHRAMRQAELDA